jgi:hypothetical protein
MAMFNPILGSNPFVQAGAMNFQNPSAMYSSAYNAAAATNSNLYRNIMSGYGTMFGNFQGLQNQVMGLLAGTNRANIQDIANRFSALSGQQSQQMIDRGLGNTTIQQSAQQGIARSRAQETTRSRGMFGQLQASTLSNLGLASLGAQQNQLNFENSIMAPYPDPGIFAQLAMRQGGMSGLPGMPGPAPSLGPTGGYMPDLWGGSGAIDFQGGGGGGQLGQWATGQPAPNAFGGAGSSFGSMTVPFMNAGLAMGGMGGGGGMAGGGGGSPMGYYGNIMPTSFGFGGGNGGGGDF